ncbi:hypothetical protein SEA_PARTRIDGE_62 [Rhodococcus phage Partridge]|uniref:Uncharacterized protein n=4 Tax=Rerduovirus TaxID=1982375 RepID=A0A6G6XS66_9CAUD|nr:hypothetical protein HWB63_gp11 [Rhodococcus phage Takoda]AOZ62883.1 hypothetical protein SEA_PARTRIDGE_62 [Rhodococcus phage Partridge]AQP30922.1 hypothetical protein SEA_ANGRYORCHARD_60 [Rhodococcus phage AngryOrchard]AWY06324.1 hypothetical protein PBI_TAKODA_63 [Rhodococcus phage Takoda]QIG61672.1 hypothetical protein SEA_DINGER_62 [Rhodococcus phage Dinger]
METVAVKFSQHEAHLLCNLIVHKARRDWYPEFDLILDKIRHAQEL